MIIRNRNEAETLVLVLESLAVQDLALEIILVDNESSDGSVELARAAGAHIVTIASNEFTYGGSLNAGMAATTQEAVVVLSAHSIPVGTDFVRTAIAPLQDPAVAAVRLLRADKTGELARWAQRVGVESGAPVAEVVAGGPIASGAVFRRSLWQEIPFDESVDSDEDKVWALAATQRGRRIATAPAVYAYTRSIGLIDGLQRESRSAMGVYRATGHRRRPDPTGTLRTLASGLAAAVVAPLWRFIDGATIPARSRRSLRPGTLWTDREERQSRSAR